MYCAFAISSVSQLVIIHLLLPRNLVNLIHPQQKHGKHGTRFEDVLGVQHLYV